MSFIHVLALFAVALFADANVVRDVPEGDIEIEEVDEFSRQPPIVVALVCACVSGFGGILGSLFGVAVAGYHQEDVEFRPSWIAVALAFASGMVLFSVTVELYGELIWDVEKDSYSSGLDIIAATLLGAVVGSLLFSYIDQNTYDESLADCEAPSPRSPGGRTKPREWTPLTSSGQSRIPWVRAASFDSALSPDNIKQHWRDVWLKRSLRVQTPERRTHATDEALGLATWRVMLYQCVAQGTLLGVAAAKEDLSVVLVISIFIATFPEAFSAACLLREASTSILKIAGLWTALALLTMAVSALIAFVLPLGDRKFSFAVVSSAFEGAASGAWLAYIAGVLLPKAYDIRSDRVGIMVTLGFLIAVFIRVFGGLAEEWT